MNKPKYTKIIFCFCLLTIGVWHGRVQSQPVQPESEPNNIDVGRDNPFAEIPKEQKSIPQEVSPSSRSDEDSFEEPPQLFIEIIALKSVNAKSLKAVIGRMSSEYGSIATDDKTNSLIICDTKEHLEKILAQIRRADKTMALQQAAIEQQEGEKEQPKPELFVDTTTLKFLDAKSLKATIGKMSSEHGSISTDAKTNSLIICDTKESLEKILAEIKKADKTPQQIMVEVVILDVQLNDDTEIGINWDILSDKNYDVAYRQKLTTSRLGSTIQDTTTIGNATAFNTTGLGGDFSVISGTIRNVVHLIQQKREVEILASPRVMMVSGQSATIEAKEEIPYNEKTQTPGGGGGDLAITSTAFKDVGVKLNVTATVTDENLIYLTVQSEQKASTGESITDVPVVDARIATTSLLLKDSQVVILGGLRRQEKTKEIDQIPLLGDLPIVGELFKSTNTVVRNSELVVFLSPHIYKGEPIPDDKMAKYNEITDRPMLSIPDQSDEPKLLIPEEKENRLLEQVGP